MDIITESNRIESFNLFYLRHTQPCAECFTLARRVLHSVPIERGGSPYDEANINGLCDYHY